MKKLWILLGLAVTTNSFALSLSQMRGAATQKIDEIRMGAQQLLTELQELRRCWSENNCTKVQYDRIGVLGKKIAAGTLVLIAIAAGAAIGWQRTRPTADNAARKFNVDLTHQSTGQNDAHLLRVIEQSEPSATTLLWMGGKQFSIRGLKAAQWLADEKKNRDVYNHVTRLLGGLQEEKRKI